MLQDEVIFYNPGIYALSLIDLLNIHDGKNWWMNFV